MTDTPAHVGETPAAPPFLPPKSIEQAKANLKYFRKERGLSQQKLAARLHVMQPSVNRWESSNNLKFIPYERIEDVAAALNISSRYLAINSFIPVANLEPRTAFDYATGDTVALNITPATTADFKNNLRYYRVKKHLSQRQLSKKLGLSSSMCSIWEREDHSYMPTHIAQTVARILDADISLICPLAPSEKDVTNATNDQVTPVKEYNNDLDRVFDSRSNVSAFATLNTKDPILNMTTSAAGFAGDGFNESGLQFDSSIADLLGLKVKDGLAAAKVVGDSMFNPITGAGIPDGAVVIIDTSKKDVNSCIGKVVCYMTNGYYMLKRLQCNRGILNAASDNPNYFPIFYTNDQDVQLMGEVVCILSKPM